MSKPKVLYPECLATKIITVDMSAHVKEKDIISP